ncbi:LysR substrate-binding domain-containing protein [Rhizobium alvei]|uniref:LysR substrate-binding domain-containing protein n=2 Tax=Rhizobium alvei TaxID=1132659 RepID=A0ABT8YP74_9HYPH|nr:LysR substrate-binding domain-containing protein [Rhizobium alvei]MDO6965479.1 LysR substrate-binding domain-containing protein [Rhizobium alvei]
MKRARLPLTALRAFESAGRLGGFSRAAEELHVSQAAISRQIRELEGLIGQPLFTRIHRGVVLTEKGRALLSEVTQSFDRIDAALSDAGAQLSGSVKVSAEPTFAALWLAPHIQEFRHSRPEIEVEIDADPRLVEFRGGALDLAIRHSRGPTSWPRVEAMPLLDTQCRPVMSPAFLAHRRLALPGDLVKAPLLHEENRSGWSDWFRSIGVEPPTEKGTVFADGGMALSASLRGHGAALFDPRLIDGELASGALVAPFAAEVNCGAYFLIARSFEALSPPARAFVDWISAAFTAS